MIIYKTKAAPKTRPTPEIQHTINPTDTQEGRFYGTRRTENNESWFMVHCRRYSRSTLIGWLAEHSLRVLDSGAARLLVAGAALGEWSQRINFVGWIFLHGGSV
jgi:hypothetical protein